MAFSSLTDFLAMGGYAFYVWLAYGISLVSLVILVINTLYKKKQIFARIEQNIERKNRIDKAKNTEGIL